MPKWIAGLTAVVILAILVYIVWHTFRPGGGPERCELLAKQQTATVDIGATVAGLELVQAKIGVTAGQVQEVDQILKDYAFKYTTMCRDNAAGKIVDAEYNCRRDNMDKVLGAARSLALTLDTIKSIADPTSQKDIVLKDIDLIRDLAQADFAKGCGSALVVTPSTLTFAGATPERTIQIANGGNRDLTYTVTDLPEAFVAVQLSGSISVGQQAVVVAIKRAVFPIVIDKPLAFYVKDNFNSKVAVTLSVDAVNAQLYRNLAAETEKGKPEGHPVATLEDALASVQKSYPGIRDAATQSFLAAGALKELGSFTEAERALTALSTQNTALYQAPATQLLAGVVAFQRNDGNLALSHFSNATATAPHAGGDVSTAAKLASGAVQLSKGNQVAADKIFGDADVRHRVVVDPNFSKYVAGEFKVPDLANVVMAAKPVKQM